MNRFRKLLNEKTSQPLKWHGGKSYLADWIVDNFPARDLYTHYAEPYAGGLSVLFRHNPEGKSESVNDLSQELSDFWYVLANAPDQMIRALWATPLSQVAWEESIGSIGMEPDQVKRATKFFVRYRQSRQGLGKDYCTPTSRTRRGMNENASAWLSAVEGLPEAHKRLRRVEVRCMDAIDFIRKYDHPKALFYCDPPYLHETRVTTKEYVHEMGAECHQRLLNCLSEIEGMFVLSGYESQMYNEAAKAFQWRSVKRLIDNKASSKKTKDKRTEVLWMNY